MKYALFALVTAVSLAAQSHNGSDIVRGPVFSATIRGPKSNDTIAKKGIIVTLGSEKRAFICYDTDLMRASMGWTGEFLEFGNTQVQITWPPPPQVKGNAVFASSETPGWSKAGSFADPREDHQGPLPKDWAHYKGFYQDGRQVVFAYSVGALQVLEMPGYQTTGQGIFTRTFEVPSSQDALSFSICQFDANAEAKLPENAHYLSAVHDDRLAIALLGEGKELEFAHDHGELILKIAPHAETLHFTLAVSPAKGDAELKTFGEGVASLKTSDDLAAFCKGGPVLWTEETVTKGVIGSGSEPYVIDTLTEPTDNPYHAKTFFSGFDFFKDGRAAICTFHGDVWIVSGIDKDLDKLTWKRYATGLFQPLGLKIVDDTVYVLGRDQITRLHDQDHNGEADYYENFNNDTVVTSNYHEFTLDLQTDSEGNFYFVKGSPWEPDVTSRSQGCMFKISKDGSKSEVIATGFRAPNGMAVGPNDELTVSDNQGHWMPASKLNWIEKGGFYGMTPAAHRELKLWRDGTNFVANPSDPKVRAKYGFKGWDAGSPQPEGFDQPVCWLPMNMDNSSGGQVWATSKKWGPLAGKLLFMSYGKCTLFEVMLDEVDQTRQAAMVQFPFKFTSGVMRGRTNPRDGQVYLCGLKGWQTSATRDGGFYRVRYTGQPVHMPDAFHGTQRGIQIGFTCALDPKTAADAGSYSVERWNYKWTGAYGSPEYSVDNPTVRKHDKLNVTSVRLSPDRKSVFLEVPNMKPSDQIKVSMSLDAADGADVTTEIYGTIHKLGATKLTSN
jgi:hypothetical protein